MYRFPLVLVAVATLATACGGASDVVTSAEPGAAQTAGTTATASAPVDDAVLIDAAWATTEAGSARSTFRAAVTGADGAAGDAFGGTGFVDFGSQRGTLDLDISELIESNDLQGVEGSFDMVFDGNVTYLQAPLLNALFGAPTPWLRFDVSALPASDVSSFGDGLRSLTQFAGHDPATPLDLLTCVVPGTVELIGDDTVGDTPTTRYTAVVELSKALATTPAPVRDRLVNRIGVDELTVEAHLDAEGRLRRLTYVEGAGSTSTAVEWEYTDYGSTEQVVVPAPEDISDLFDVVPAL